MHVKKVAILQSNYAPWKGYFDIIRMVDEFVFYDDVQFTKNDWRNRNRIKTAQGVKWITIPVLQSSLDQKICETLVASSSWGKKHWQTLITNYSKSEYFDYYRPRFEDFYLNCTHKLLSDINQSLIRLINELLGIQTSVKSSLDYQLNGDRNERLIDLIKKLNGNIYLSGPAARSYLDQSMFKEAGISIEWMDYSGYPKYRQHYPPFEHAVSILDLVFNEGPNALQYMKKLL